MAIPRSFGSLVIGQSYGATGYRISGAYFAFCEAVRQAIDANPAAVSATLGISVAAGDLLQSRNLAVPGSAILEANAEASGYWVENDLVTAGPHLAAALSAIAGFGQKPSFILYSHGEQEAGFGASGASLANAKTAITNVLFPALRSALKPGSPNDIPIFVDMLGPRYLGTESSEFEMRDRLIEVIEAGTRVYKGVEKYALQLDSTVHPADLTNGYLQMGAHAGRKVAEWLLDPTKAPSGPTISGAVRSGNDVVVSITVPNGKTLMKPLTPDFFGLYDAAGVRLQLRDFAWSGNNLTISAARQPATLRYPVRTGRANVETGNIIRLSNPASPVYEGETGLVLESIKTTAL